MMVSRFAAPWIATAALLVGFGSVLAAEERAPVSDDPVTRLESELPGSPQDDPVGATPDVPVLPQSDDGPIRLGALAFIGVLAARRGPMNRFDSSPSRGPPGHPGPPAISFPLALSRIDNTPLDPPHRWNTGRGPPTLRSTPTCAPRSACLTT